MVCTLPRTYSVDSLRRLSCPGARIRRRRRRIPAAAPPSPHFGAPPLAVVARHSPPRHPVIAWCRPLAAALNFGGGTAAAAQEEKRRKEKRAKKTQENKKRRRIAVGCTCIANELHFSTSSSLVRAPAHWFYRYSWGKLEQHLQQLHRGLLLSSRSIAFDSISQLCIGWSFALVLVLVFFFFSLWFVFLFFGP